MKDIVEVLGYGFVLGVGATVFMDIYALVIKKLFAIPSLNYAFVGRWIGSFPKGVFSHANIVQAPPVQNEKALDWLAHYCIGITFGIVLLLLSGLGWLSTPTFWPAFGIGVGTTVFPFFMMQPAFGFGVAAAKLPNPNITRLRSLMAHAIFGIGLYLTGILLSVLIG